MFSVLKEGGVEVEECVRGDVGGADGGVGECVGVSGRLFSRTALSIPKVTLLIPRI